MMNPIWKIRFLQDNLPDVQPLRGCSMIWRIPRALPGAIHIGSLRDLYTFGGVSNDKIYRLSDRIQIEYLRLNWINQGPDRGYSYWIAPRSVYIWCVSNDKIYRLSDRIQIEYHRLNWNNQGPANGIEYDESYLED